MTWTLRLYDGTDTEVAVVTKTDDGTYSYSVTNADPEWDDYGVELSGWRKVWSDSGGPTEVQGPKFRLINDPSHIEGTLTPKEHLERIQDDFGSRPEVGSTTLADE